MFTQCMAISGPWPRAATPLDSASQADADRALVRGTLAGRRQDFEVLVARYQKPIQRFAVQQIGDESAAEEVVQATFVQAYVHLAEFRGEASFKTWLYGIALNLCRDRGRAASRRREVPVDGVPEAELGTTAALEDTVLGGTVERRLAALPERQRTVLTLRVWGDLAFKEIARTLGITENAAKVSYHYAVRRLREWLRESV